MGLRRVTPFSDDLIDLVEMKLFVHIDGSTEDTTVKHLIATAEELLSQEMNRCFRPVEWEYTRDCWSHQIELPMAPVISVDSIVYADENNAEQTLDPAQYDVNLTREPATITPIFGGTGWPALYRSPNAVRIAFTAGYEPTASSGSDGARSNIPPTMLLAVKQFVAHWFKYREPIVTGTIVADVPFMIKNLVHPYKMFL